MVSLAWIVGENDLEATVGSVVGPLALFTIAVSHIVCILLFKLWGQKQINPNQMHNMCLIVYTFSGSIFLTNSALQKAIAWSSVSPMLLRNSPYCRRPKCLRWCSLRRVSCKLLIQGGKDCFETYTHYIGKLYITTRTHKSTLYN